MKLKQLTMAFILIMLSSCSNYSTGERTGIITKFSFKGMLWKTWEGELLQGGIRKNQNGSEANVFAFSLDPDRAKDQNNGQLIDTIQVALENGLPVRLSYSEEQLTNCGSRGETSHFITAIKIIRE